MQYLLVKKRSFMTLYRHIVKLEEELERKKSPTLGKVQELLTRIELLIQTSEVQK